MAFAQTATNSTPTICTEPGSGFAGSAICTPVLCSKSDIGVAETSVPGCKIASQLTAASLDGAVNVDTLLHARGCAENSTRISRRSAAIVPAKGTPEGPGRRDDEIQDPGGEPFEYPAQPAMKAMLKNRAKKVLLAEGESPAATDDVAVVSQASVAFVLALDEVVQELWKECADEIKRRCGPSMPKGLIDRPYDDAITLE